jgi:hypothetical protein
VTEGAFPVNWIIDKGLALRGGMQISYDAKKKHRGIFAVLYLR